MNHTHWVTIQNHNSTEYDARNGKSSVQTAWRDKKCYLSVQVEAAITTEEWVHLYRFITITATWLMYP